ncbi:hypothetical protein OT109_05525 [Phycisphaeraceae bacterium D3-23]
MHKPQVITWFYVYCVLMILIYVALAVGGFFLMKNPDFLVDPEASFSSNAPRSTDEAVFMGMLYIGLGVVFAIAFIVPFVLPRKFGTWVYSIVLICLGLTSCLFWPITIPLLIFWVKAETRLWYKNETPQAIDMGNPYQRPY